MGDHCLTVHVKKQGVSTNRTGQSIKYSRQVICQIEYSFRFLNMLLNRTLHFYFKNDEKSQLKLPFERAEIPIKYIHKASNSRQTQPTWNLLLRRVFL